jgi:Alpha/beta hydrolase domain
VDNEPPKVGKAFVGLVPAVDENGNSRAGIRMPQIEVPVGTYGGWNFRAPSIGASDQLLGENGSFHPFPCTKAARTANDDSRISVQERYASRQEYLSRATLAAQQMVKDGFLLAVDLNGMVDGSVRIYDWVIKSYCKE